MERQRFHVVTNREMLISQRKGIVVEAHPDDHIMATVNEKLVQSGVGLSVATFTDGAARAPERVELQKMRALRRRESPRSVREMGGAQVYGADLPDGKLTDFQEEGCAFLRDIIGKTEPQFIIAPNPEDPHSDHSAAAEIVREVAGEIPVYYMDTIRGVDKNGNIISPTHYVTLSQENVEKRKRSYFANKSQITNNPPDEEREIQAVVAMTERRGHEVHIPHAGVLIQDRFGFVPDPISELLKDDICVAERGVII